MGAHQTRPTTTSGNSDLRAHALSNNLIMMDIPIFVVTFTEGKRCKGVDEFLTALNAIRQAWPHAVVKDESVLWREVPFKISVKLQPALDTVRDGKRRRRKSSQRKYHTSDHFASPYSRDLWVGSQADLLRQHSERREQSIAEITAAVSQYRQEFLLTLQERQTQLNQENQQLPEQHQQQ